MGPFKAGWTKADAEAIIARNDPEDVLYVPIVVSLDPPDLAWAQDICIRLSSHEHEDVRANAVLGFGHLARICGELDEARVRPIIEAAFHDPTDRVRGAAGNAASDTGMFLDWLFPTRPEFD